MKVETRNAAEVLSGFVWKNDNGWYAGFKDRYDYGSDTEFYGEEVSGCEDKKKAVWLACVNFINYYNNLD